jgi:hypothetical protein
LQSGGEVDADAAELLLQAGDPVVRFTGDELLVHLQEQGVPARPDRMQPVRHLVYGGASPAPVILHGSVLPHRRVGRYESVHPLRGEVA